MGITAEVVRAGRARRADRGRHVAQAEAVPRRPVDRRERPIDRQPVQRVHARPARGLGRRDRSDRIEREGAAEPRRQLRRARGDGRAHGRARHRHRAAPHRRHRPSRHARPVRLRARRRPLGGGREARRPLARPLRRARAHRPRARHARRPRHARPSRRPMGRRLLPPHAQLRPAPRPRRLLPVLRRVCRRRRAGRDAGGHVGRADAERVRPARSASIAPRSTSPTPGSCCRTRGGRGSTKPSRWR